MNKDGNIESNEDLLLNRLIRKIREDSSKLFNRPADEDISAYLIGDSTEKQEKTIKKALLQSAEFRRELLEMAKDIDALENIDLDAPENRAAISEIPDYIDFLKKHEDSAQVKIKKESFWVKIIELKIPQLYAPAVAAAVLAFVVLYTGMFAPDGQQFAEWQLEKSNIEKAYLVSMQSRTPQTDRIVDAKPTAEDAAMAEFRQLLRHENGEFHLVSVTERLQLSTPYKAYFLKLLDEKENIIDSFQMHVPLVKENFPRPVTAWALGLPSRDLYKFDIKSDTVNVFWTETMGSKGCLTLTYHDTDGFRAILGYTFEM